jgi:uncharacterized DUF497 family protein
LIEFEWDAENILHIARHNVTPDEVEYVLLHATLDTGFDQRDGEERYKEAGATATGRILEVVTTFRGSMVRTVTAYDASSFVIKEYYRTRGRLWPTK